MDPRERADALLSRARARGKFVVTPDNATSPMDAANTQQIPRSVVSEIDQGADPDTTTKLSAATIEANDNFLTHSAQTTRLGGAPAPRGQQPEQVEEEVGGLIPTTKTTPTQRSNLSRRLDGI
ncbi:hypothetical protein [Amycolatopsis suaedae]|uniref:Uncharacterized protein n=1 Tax=Amycolatopsis suaedae TaxID=2510978 RepID=A0A4Q7J722_9PSEU|nr:hypothetical protein [Amycolatopsis suaedae]RZQ62708.1 hypothetical protein EWH70_17250 [Amycolatopsis suaedae]